MKDGKKQILVYRLGSLGDTIIVLPCFHKVKEAFPEAEITLLTNRPVHAKAAPVLSIIGNNFFDSVIDYPVGVRDPRVLLKLIWQIRALKIDTIVNLTAARSMKAAVRDRWFFRAAGIKQFIGFPDQEQDFRISTDQETGEYEWEAKRLSRRIKSLGKLDLNDQKYWDLLFSDQEKVEAEELTTQFSGRPILALSPGTKMQSKDWGQENWVNFTKHISQLLPDHVLFIIGAPDEYQIGEECRKVWSGDSLNLCGKTSPRVSAVILSKCKVFIGHDSGPMHLASAVETPCVALFSARNLPGQWFPRGNHNVILYHKTDCAGCYLETCVIEKKKCILSITVDEVATAVLSVLNNT